MDSLFLDDIDLQLLNALQDDATASNQTLAAAVRVSPPTCLRRVKRLRETGLIEREVALVQPDALARHLGHGITAIVEVTLDRQDAERLAAFEQRMQPEAAVQQCYRVSPGPDFVLVVYAQDIPGYLALAQRLFSGDGNARNVKAFFSLKRSKFEPKVPCVRPAIAASRAP
ncbi:Lrp/AsnC family transcriptional regulator [Acidovorax sp. NCPPB 3576]|uniref:Lrp/AsnC family transcriptional regulator n=1 Tax=Acidovorax sp. NCPPB 3576 TaxID=2940488 RepID=UPI002349AC39|nr:Lrp/AsnC family transcriptional regulator [Acidovorax sp. NCPPB 3576]WCM89240.1 Lrp/AsnC family transcriptional regulator [Acidovorax sp. NCPPB 3576]